MRSDIFKKIIIIVLGIILMVAGKYCLYKFNMIIGVVIIAVLSTGIGVGIFNQTRNPLNNFIITFTSSIVYVLLTIYIDLFEPEVGRGNELIIVFLVSYIGINIACIIYKFLNASMKEYKKYLKYSCIYFVFAYVVLLADLLFFSARFRYSGRVINIMPFKTIIPYLMNDGFISTKVIIMNLFGNIILFIPFGFIIYIFIKNKFRVMMYLFMIPIIVEVIQFIASTGVSDIDDIILNFMGGVIGFFINLLVEMAYERRHKNKVGLMFEV